MSAKKKTDELHIPFHVAFIMDGNGRWAKKRGLPREIGHRQGAATFKKIVRYCGKIGIGCVTVYAFSTENWKRPQREVQAIMKLLDDYLDTCERELDDDPLQIHFIGDMSPLPDSMREKIERLEKRSAVYDRILNIALNYGSRNEIVHAFRTLSAKGVTDPTEDDISRALYTAHCKDPDLIVRTGGEKRLSNYLLWQSAYAELYFTDVLWPDLSEADVDEAVRYYSGCSRRFGGLDSGEAEQGK
ncbi:MAG: di-trans,poly-cis-decaprenylcistransferase [Clostridia bacterium]|nr:di-trans,poly-cis-decaprenylcistransferase [Clostridia bacterium]